MPLVTTEAIVLRTYRLAEADKIVVCMTHGAGLVRGVARGARRLKSRFGASLEPWTICELTYFEKEGRELVTFQNVEIKRSSFALSSDSERVNALDYMSELALEFMPPHQANPNMFRMIKACGEAIHEACVDIGRLTQYFELWTLRLSGFLPLFKSCTKCRHVFTAEDKLFVSVEGTVRCTACATGTEVLFDPQIKRLIQLMQRQTPQQYACVPSTHDDLVAYAQTSLQQMLRRFITRALEHEPRGLVNR